MLLSDIRLTNEIKTMSLKQNIQNFQDEFIPTIPEATLNQLMSELHSLIDTGIAEKSIQQGQSFPDFDLPDANSSSRKLSHFLISGPLVISFYRGAWCPYCNLEINALQQRLPEIAALGAQLVAISPQKPEKLHEQVVTSDLGFEVLSDLDNQLAKQCGLVFTLPESLRPIYSAWQIDIPDHNGNDHFELPIPATYIINTDGKIHYRFADMDYTKRLEPDLIIEQLKSL